MDFIHLKTVWFFNNSDFRHCLKFEQKLQFSDICTYLVRFCLKYSRCPKTGCPVWQTGRKYVRILNRPDFRRPGCSKSSGFQTSDWYQSSDNRTILSGFRTFGQTGSKPVCLVLRMSFCKTKTH